MARRKATNWTDELIAYLLALANNPENAIILRGKQNKGQSQRIPLVIQRSRLVTSRPGTWAQFRIDGVLCPHFQLPTVGVPQGSPLSPVLSSLYSIPLLVASIDPQAHSFAYIDDFTILAYSNSHAQNIEVIKEVTSRISNVAEKLGLEFELPKSELIHFIRHGAPHSNPSLTLSNDGIDTVINPQDCVRWLGFWLDRKLAFKQHVQNMATKAKATIAGLRMLANTTRGLSIRHARILFKAHVIPILMYGAPLWFYGRSRMALLKPLKVVQNEGIRWLLGAFKTTPVPVMEHLSSIPPLHVTCQRLIDNMATKLRSIPRLAELARRLPSAWETADTSIPTTATSPISSIADRSHPHIEPILPYLVHPSETGTPFPDNFEVRLNQGKPRADIVKEHIAMFKANATAPQPDLVCYSDGHAKVYSGCPKIAYGFAIYIKGIPRILLADSIGPRATIFDAEMLGLAKCLTKAVRFASSNPHYTHIKLYCDNRAAVQTIHSLHRHPAQYASLIFRRALDLFLDGHPERHITLSWIPGHSGIPGNDLADTLANGGASVPPKPIYNRTITWARTQATRHASRTWKRAWTSHCQSRPNSSWFIPRDPSLKLHPIFNKWFMPRNVSSRLVQLISGHGFYGEYTHRFHPGQDDRCGCGESQYSIAHALAFCSQQEEQRHILRKCSPDLNFQELFGSLPGLKAVSRFIAATGIGKATGSRRQQLVSL